MNTLDIAQIVVTDVMQRDPFTIAASETLRDAMNVMTQNHISGLPVVDSRGRCVGLISATDILNYEQERSDEVDEGNADTAPFYNTENGRWEVIRLSAFALERFGDVRVAEVMSQELVSVAADATVQDAAATMSRAQVHRIVIVDAANHLQGLLSATDLVDLLAGAV